MKPPPVEPIEESSDEQLLTTTATAGAPSTTVRAAQAEFYRRHVRYLYGVLKRREGLLARLAGIGVEDLVQETFQRAFQYADTYRGDSEARDADARRRRTRAWLGRIAQNLILDELARPEERSASLFIERVAQPADELTPASSPRLRAVRRALDGLSDREQDVLRVTALYQRPGVDHQRLPNEISAELAARWGTTSENIRAIRSRALKKLATEVDLALDPEREAP